MQKIILASASPRRKELLEQIGWEFEIQPAKGEEVITKDAPQEVVMELALQKAREIAADYEEAMIIGADTVVAYEGEILGKPKDEEDAIRMLTMLSGNTHFVYTGVALIIKTEGKEQVQSFYEETKVKMYPIRESEIQAYVKTKEPLDKAGSYAIQGKSAIFVEKIEGDYNNVVGLPIARIYQEILSLGIEIS